MSGTSEYISTSDEAEFLRLQALAGGQSLGDPIYQEDSEFQETLDEMGFFTRTEE